MNALPAIARWARYEFRHRLVVISMQPRGRPLLSMSMRPYLLWLLAGALLARVASAFAGTLELVQTIPLVASGRIDHLSIDARSNRLFVAALGNHSLEVVNLATGAVRSIGDLGKPQGVAYSASLNHLFVADGDRAVVATLDSETLAAISRTEGLADADNLRYDPVAERVYVGYGEGGIRVLDAKTGASVADIKLPAHPEGFAIGRDGKRLFANVPDAGAIVVLDTERKEIVQRWSMQEAKANFPLALDETDRRVFVGARRPPTILVYDMDTGRRAASFPIGGDVDDIFFDRESGRLFAICGDGFIDVIQQLDRDHYRAEARVATRSGARTGLYVPELRRLYVAVPRHLGKSAEVQAYAWSGEATGR